MSERPGKRQYLLYIAFAALSTAVNLGSQFLIKSLVFPDDFPNILFVQLLVGTCLGFAVKFVLDKFIVFKSVYSGIRHTFKQICVYGAFAVITTIIFWGIEFMFSKILSFKHADIIGGFVGLSIGYTVKFMLDKRYVFNAESKKRNES